MFKKDAFGFGILLGFIVPMLGLTLLYLIKFLPLHATFPEYLRYLTQYKSVLTAFTSISLVANAAVFTIYINGHRDKTSKGIFTATMIYGIVVLLIKFFS